MTHFTNSIIMNILI